MTGRDAFVCCVRPMRRRGVWLLIDAEHSWWSPAGSEDIDIIARQLRRKPHAVLAVARRCRFGAPQVIVNHPVARGHVFPTMYWLTCPYLSVHVSRLEGQGEVTRTKDWLERTGLLTRMAQVHGRAAQERLAVAQGAGCERLRCDFPAQWAVVAETGVGGARAVAGVKCLHMHLADYLAGPAGAERIANEAPAESTAGARNPAGARTATLLLQNGVDITGWPGCAGCPCWPDWPYRKLPGGGCLQQVYAIGVETDSCWLQQSEMREGRLVRWASAVEAIHLGTGAAAGGGLSFAAVNRFVAALAKLLAQANLTGLVPGAKPAMQIVAVGDPALHDAVDASYFLLQAWERLGLAVRLVPAAAARVDERDIPRELAELFISDYMPAGLPG